MVVVDLMDRETGARKYAAHYNRHRPRRARNLRPPDSDGITTAATTDLATAGIRRRTVPGGLINEYQWAA